MRAQFFIRGQTKNIFKQAMQFLKILYFGWRRNAVFFLFLIFSRNLLFSQEWIQQNSPTNSPIVKIFFINKSTGWFISLGDSIYKTTDEGKSWKRQSGFEKYSLNNIFFVNEYTGWILGNLGILMKTTDGGGTWIKQDSKTTYDLRGYYFFDSNNGWIVGEGTQPFDHGAAILKTTDGGNTWNNFGNVTMMPASAVFFIDSLEGWIGGIESAIDMNSSGFIIHTTDGGKNWNIQEPRSRGGFRNIFFLNKKNGYANGLQSASLKTTDGGNSWLSFQPKKVLGSPYIGLKVFDTNNIFMADWESVFRTNDGGKTWIKHRLVISSSDGLLHIFLLDSNYGWCGSARGNLWKYEEEPNSISETKNAKNYELNLTCFPNPANPNTVISYQLPIDGLVSLKIYDLNGREVRTLVHERQNNGFHSIDFVGSNLASGVYFCNLSVENRNISRKLILLK